MKKTLLLISIFLVSVALHAQIVSTLAGGTQGDLDGTGTAAQFNSPRGIVTDASGNIFIADIDNHKIKMITPSGVVTTFAGTGTAGDLDGPLATATFNRPANICFSSAGMFVCEMNGCVIRRISNGMVTTVAGSVFGHLDGQGAAAQFGELSDIVADPQGNLYVTDYDYNCIRKIDPAYNVTTFAGTTAPGFANGPGSTAMFYNPHGLAIDFSNNLYVADKGNSRIRKITPSGDVSTFAGSGLIGSDDGSDTLATFGAPMDIAIDLSGIMYVVDGNYNDLRKIGANVFVSTIANNAYTPGYSDGNADTSKFAFPTGVTAGANGIVYITDLGNFAVRQYTPGTSTSIQSISKVGIKLFPNPASTVLHLELDAPSVVTVYNNCGVMVMSELVSNGELNIADLVNGLYFIDANVNGIKCQQTFLKD